jgi:peroxiredoxin
MKTILHFLCIVSLTGTTFCQAWVEASYDLGHLKPGLDATSFGNALQADINKCLGAPLPRMRFLNLETGRPDSLISYRGRVVLINTWQTWCGACLGEMPDLAKLYNKLRPKGFALLSISPEDPEKLAKFFRGTEVAGIRINMPRDAYLRPMQYMVNPSAYLIDRGGVLRAFWMGPQPYPELERGVSRLLEEKH